MKFVPYPYQVRAINKIESEPSTGLFLDMGLGKSVIALTAANDLMKQGKVHKILIVAPLMVAKDTWPREIAKWDHLKDLRVSLIVGNAKQRKKAAEADADVYIINRENIKKLSDEYGQIGMWKWDMLILDELSSFKSHKSQRFKGIRRVRPFCHYIIGLTGTPQPNGLEDLWAEMYLLDGGKRLGKTISAYHAAYFRPGEHYGYVVYNWIPKPGAQEEIISRISDITMSMLAKDYLDLPKRIDNNVSVTLSRSARKNYQSLAKEHLLELDEDDDISAVNAAVLMGKLLQLTGGSIYTDNKEVQTFSNDKLQMLVDLIEEAGEPVMVYYGYRHERDRIMTALKDYAPRELKTPEDVKDWNDGKITVAIAHPASVGYGLNLQDGGRIIIWYSLPWSLEYYQQANARLYRQGQQKPVLIYHLIAEHTVDEVVMKCLETKDTSQQALLRALKDTARRVSA